MSNLAEGCHSCVFPHFPRWRNYSPFFFLPLVVMSTDQESAPNQNETNKPKTHDALKPETETSSKKSAPPKTTANQPKADEATTLSYDDPESDPNAKNIPQTEIQTSFKYSPPKDALSQTTSMNRSRKDYTEALKKDTAAGADPQMLENPPSEDKSTSKHTSPSNNGSTATNKQEVDGTKAIKQDSIAVAEITPANPRIQPVKNESTSKDSSPPSQAIASREPETDKGKTDSVAVAEITPANLRVQPVKNESTSKDSSPPSQAIATHEPETDEGKTLAEELPKKVDPHPPVQEISPADDEATPKELPTLKNDSSQTSEINDPESRPAETLKEDSTNGAELRPKKSKWKKLRDYLLLRKGKVSKSESSTISQDSNVKGDVTKPDEKQLQISLIRADIDYITKRVKELGLYNNRINSILDEDSKEFEDLKEQGKLEDLQELRKHMMKLKLQDPSKYKFDADEKDHLKNLQFHSKAKQGIFQQVLSKMPQLHKSEVFETSIEFKDFEARYNGLDDRLKLCLLCFSVFPEKIIRKRLMLQWWVAEGFASEDEASEFFNQLIEKGFIEPVNKNRSLSVGSCQMHPFYRSALVMLAERAKFFNFGAKGEPTQNFSGSFQACLVGEGLISFEDLKEKKLEVDDLEKLHLLINVDEHILEFKRDWFSKMTNLNFLHLGRWQVLATEHIEVEDNTNFLSGLEKMNCVKLLSLQGISNIIVLPKSILQFKNLNTLDVRACNNLETIPERIDFLKNLTHLDMSECYLLDHMPRSLSSLKELKVIKGFVVGIYEESNIPCTLDDLKTLLKLRKLCIYTGLFEFPEERHVQALEKLIELCKLTITWGGSALRATTDNQPDNGNKKGSSTAANGTQRKQESQGSSKSPNGSGQKGRLPPKLEKLDLKCFPKSTTPYWLELKNLKDRNLKKLYIRGGKLSDLGQYHNIDNCNLVLPVKKETWKVEVLRLKYLSEIEIEWRQLHELFPSLVYLEQVSCPKLTLFPCDENGIWINKTKSKTSIHTS